VTEAHHGVDDERVLDVDQHADRGIDAREFLDRQHGMKEAAARAAVSLGDLDPHDAEVEELVDERPWNLRVLVHFTDEGPDLRVGEGPHAVPENRLVLGENGEGLRVFDNVFAHDGDVIIAQASRPAPQDV
jgi:hypothetical protein